MPSKHDPQVDKDFLNELTAVLPMLAFSVVHKMGSRRCSIFFYFLPLAAFAAHCLGRRLITFMTTGAAYSAEPSARLFLVFD